MTYKVYYKKSYKSFSVWKVLRNVKGDGIVENGMSRFFTLEDESRVEIPVGGIIFKFGKERWFIIKERMESEAKQSIPIDKR